MKHLLKKHRMLSVGIFLAAVLSIIYAAILSPAGKSTGSFSDFCTTLFREEMKSNTMNLHFTLKDPKTFGRTQKICSPLSRRKRTLNLQAALRLYFTPAEPCCLSLLR